MIIDKILLQNEEPRFKGVLWADPIENGIALKLYNNGKWHVVGGSGSGCNCNNVIIVHDYEDETFKIGQGNFENAFNTLSNGIPINITIYSKDGNSFLQQDQYVAGYRHVPAGVAGAPEDAITITVAGSSGYVVLVWTSSGIEPLEGGGPK